jgi:hypothetical protein
MSVRVEWFRAAGAGASVIPAGSTIGDGTVDPGNLAVLIGDFGATAAVIEGTVDELRDLVERLSTAVARYECPSTDVDEIPPEFPVPTSDEVGGEGGDEPDPVYLALARLRTIMAPPYFGKGSPIGASELVQLAADVAAAAGFQSDTYPERRRRWERFEIEGRSLPGYRASDLFGLLVVPSRPAPPWEPVWSIVRDGLPVTAEGFRTSEAAQFAADQIVPLGG